MSAKITALRVQKRNSNRVNVHLDGEFAFGLSRIVAAWLQVGQELSPEKIAALKAEDSNEVALQRAVNFLSYRPRSRKEVQDNLRKHKVAEEVIEAVVQRLARNGMVDDRAFAQMWIENRSEFRPRGSFALRMELRQKGVPEATIEQALEGLDEETLAYQAGLRKASRFRDLDERTFKQKMYGFLSRRGFQYETIQAVVNRIWQEK